MGSESEGDKERNGQPPARGKRQTGREREKGEEGCVERGDKGAWKRRNGNVDRSIEEWDPGGAATWRGVCFNAVVLHRDFSFAGCVLFSTSTEIDFGRPTRRRRQCYRVAPIFRDSRSVS